MNKKLLLPLALFVITIGVLWRGLSLHASEIPSPLINEPAPAFELPTLLDPNKMTSNRDFYGHVTLVNVWASWCSACAQEYGLLLKLSQNKKLFFYGIAYKDNHENAINWIRRYGNPYRIIAVDDEGDTAINWGVYGTPELFVLDKKGRIRYKQVGSISEEMWRYQIAPVVKKLEAENF